MEKESRGLSTITVIAWLTGHIADSTQPMEDFSQLLWYTLVLKEANILKQDEELEDMLKKTKTLPFDEGQMAGKEKKRKENMSEVWRRMETLLLGSHETSLTL